MHPARILPAILAVALWAAAPPAQGHGGDDADEGDEAHGRLLPPDGSPQPEARGEIEISAGLERQTFEVDVEGADPDVALSVFLDDGTGTMTSIGDLAAECDGHEIVLALEFDTAAGATLPLGAATVQLLAGLAIEVRDAEARVVLAGTVPALGTGDDDDDGKDDDDGDHDDGEDGDDDDGDEDEDDNDEGDDDGKPARARAALQRAETSPFAEASGHVEVEKKHGEEELEIEAENLDAGAGVEFFLADAEGTMTSVGTAEADDEGDAEIEFETDEGGSLPFDAASVDDLAGRRVEVRAAADGTLILFGEVPEATTEARKERGKDEFEDDDSDAECRVTAMADNRSGRERLTIDLKAVAKGSAEAEVLVDAGGGSMTLADRVALKRNGRGRAKYDTRKGDALPMGASSVTELEGRAFEIRVEGDVVITGTFPRLRRR